MAKRKRRRKSTIDPWRPGLSYKRVKAKVSKWRTGRLKAKADRRRERDRLTKQLANDAKRRETDSAYLAGQPKQSAATPGGQTQRPTSARPASAPRQRHGSTVTSADLPGRESTICGSTATVTGDPCQHPTENGLCRVKGHNRGRHPSGTRLKSKAGGAPGGSGWPAGTETWAARPATGTSGGRGSYAG